MKLRIKNHTSRKANHQRGKAAVEFALTAPIFFMFLFAGIEFSRMHTIRCAVENAAFEGARKGIVSGASANQCETVTCNLLESANVFDHTVTIEPADLDPTVDYVSVTVELPLTNDNGFRMAGFLKNQTFSKTITLPRESAESAAAYDEAIKKGKKGKGDE